MTKTRTVARHSNVPGLTSAFRLLSVCVTIFILLLYSNFAGAQENASQENDTLSKTQTGDQVSPASSELSKSTDEVEDKSFSVTPHRPNYFLGVTYNDNPNVKTYTEAGREVPNNYEAKFQLSIKVLIWKDLFRGRGDLFAAYTQRSWWQIYSTSSPFRETNYEPELFLRLHTDFPVVFGLRNKYFIMGATHQSNGQGVDLSRSWNRVYIEFIARKGNFMLGLKPWYRIPENDESDDNPDIDKYLGYGKLYGAYRYRDLVFSFTFHNNLRSDENRSGIELGLSYALRENLRVYLQYYNGYGESMIDYDNFTNRIGLGLMINDWL